MGPMLLLVLGILSAVGLGLYQFGEHHRFDMVSDAKGGIFIIDRKSAAINYCNDKTCSLVGNGALPSQIMGNPAALASMQGAIMGAPAAPAVAVPGHAPNGMQSNLANSGDTKPAQADVAATPHDEAGAQNANAESDVAHPEAEHQELAAHLDAAADASADAPATPEGFAFK